MKTKTLTALVAAISLAIGNTVAASASIYWGAHVNYKDGNTSDDMSQFESSAGKRVSIVNKFQSWGGGWSAFDANSATNIRNSGSIPMITWEPWRPGYKIDSNYQLSDIINGAYDAYITQWAQAALAWKHPLFLRFAHEMNGDWYPWSEQINGNSYGQYIQMWRHVRQIFNNVAAAAGKPSNVTWVWVPNVIYGSNSAVTNLARYYPGDAYVNWTGLDGYNTGDSGLPKSFYTIVKPTYDQLVALAATKPIMIAETASYQYSGKADWIRDAFKVQLPNNFPKIKAVVWFNENKEKDWRIESSAASQTAFRESLALSYYAADTFGSLPDYTPIAPIAGAAADTTPPSVSGVAASGITASAATIGWVSNEPTYSQVEYGTSLSYGQYGTFSGSLLTSHSSALSGLTAGTLYHYRIRSWDAANNMGLSGDYTFTTGASGSAGSTSFSEYFSGGTSAWTPVYGSWIISNGQYTQTNTALYRALSVAGGQMGNLTIQGDIKVVSGGQDINSLVFRYKDAGNYCSVYLSKYWGRIGVEQMRGGVRSFSEAAFASSYNTKYTLKAVVSGSQVQAYVNGSLKHTWSLPDGTTTGRIGVSNSVSTAYFDNITVIASVNLVPIATITSLANGAIVGTSIKVTASGSDDEAVARVELLADGAVAASQDFAPAVPSFTTSLAWSTLAIGTHRLQVVTYDSEGNRGESPIVSITVSNKAGSQVSLVSTQSLEQPLASSEQEPRALMMSLQQSRGAALAFSEDVEEAAVLDLHGRAVMHQRKQGNAILMSFQQSSGGRLPMESGLWLIQMKDKDGQTKVKPLMVVK